MEVLCGVPPVARIDDPGPAAATTRKELLEADAAPVEEAVSVNLPACSTANVANVAMPFASVACGGMTLRRLLRALIGINSSAIMTPAVRTGLPKLSCSCTVTGGVIATPAVPSLGCCRNPSLLAFPATLVRTNVAGDCAPVVDPVTETGPARAFAIIAGDVAMPLALVGTVAGPPKVTLGPLAGAANVTGAFAIGFPKASCTLALS